MLGSAAAEEDCELVLEFATRREIAILGGTLNCVAESAHAAQNDRNLVDRIGGRQRGRHQRVPHLVVGDELALVGVEDPVLLLEPGNDSLDCGREVAHRDRIALPARRLEGGLIAPRPITRTIVVIAFMGHTPPREKDRGATIYRR